MALKTREIREMNPADRAKALADTRGELMHERGLAAMGGAMKNPGKIRDLRTSIARILTLEHAGHLGLPGGAPPAGAAKRPPSAAAKPGAAAKPAPAKPAKPAAKAKPKAAKPAAAKPAAAAKPKAPDAKAAKASKPKSAPKKKEGGAG